MNFSLTNICGPYDVLGASSLALNSTHPCSNSFTFSLSTSCIFFRDDSSFVLPLTTEASAEAVPCWTHLPTMCTLLVFSPSLPLTLSHECEEKSWGRDHPWLCLNFVLLLPAPHWYPDIQYMVGYGELAHGIALLWSLLSEIPTFLLSRVYLHFY